MGRESICQIDSFVKMHRIHNTKNKLNVNHRVQLVLKYQYWLIDFNKCARVMQVVKIGKLCVGREGVHENSLYFPFNFSMNQKCL